MHAQRIPEAMIPNLESRCEQEGVLSATAPDGFSLPGGRGPAYTRYDLVQPREIRFTTTYSF
jgi:hypothetical protein